jgi:GNAT superfamily N-acetyltransferase
MRTIVSLPTDTNPHQKPDLHAPPKWFMSHFTLAALRRAEEDTPMDGYSIRPLTPETWDAWAALVEKHNGIWGGCWCLSYHPASPDRGISMEGNRALKRRLVQEGHAHAAVVFEGDTAIGWCQYGSPEELPRITHRMEVEAGQDVPPDYRITCFFVDRDHRRSGVAALALAGALDLIAQAGGGVVEAYPQDTPGRKVSASFLYNGTRHLFEEAGFTHVRHKGKNHCVMRALVPAGPL